MRRRRCWQIFKFALKCFLPVITKATDESQTSTDESQTTIDESQTTTDKSQTTTDKSQTTKDESHTNAVEPKTIVGNTNYRGVFSAINMV